MTIDSTTWVAVGGTLAGAAIAGGVSIWVTWLNRSTQKALQREALNDLALREVVAERRRAYAEFWVSLNEWDVVRTDVLRFRQRQGKADGGSTSVADYKDKKVAAEAIVLRERFNEVTDHYRGAEGRLRLFASEKVDGVAMEVAFRVKSGVANAWGGMDHVSKTAMSDDRDKMRWLLATMQKDLGIADGVPGDLESGSFPRKKPRVVQPAPNHLH